MLFREVVSAVSVGEQQRSVLAFYIKRLAHEQTTRLVTGVLTLAVVAFQVISVVAPPKISEASQTSSNDVRSGGFNNKSDLLKKYDQDSELRAVYDRVGIERNDIEKSHESQVNSGQSVWTLARNPHGDPKYNIQVDLPGKSSQLYLQPLNSVGQGLTFKALAGETKNGKKFWLIHGSCNPVIDPGVPPGQTPTPLPSTTARPSASPTPTPAPSSTPQPTRPTCTALKAFPFPNNPAQNPPYKVSFDVESSVKDSSQVKYLFDFGDDSKAEVDHVPIEHSFTKPGSFTVKVRVSNSLGISDQVSECSTLIEVRPTQLAYLKTAINLSLKDSHGQPTNAAGTTVKAGHEIRYTLTVRNTGNDVYPNYSFKENLTDVLEYAEISEPNGGQIVRQSTSNGVNQTWLIWPASNINSGQTETKSFTVKVKNPIPDNPTGATDPASYDLKMENFFQANRVLILLPTTPVKQVEIAAASLPQTGSIVATLAISLFAIGAFFVLVRNRFIAKELAIIATTGANRSNSQ